MVSQQDRDKWCQASRKESCRIIGSTLPLAETASITVTWRLSLPDVRTMTLLLPCFSTVLFGTRSKNTGVSYMFTMYFSSYSSSIFRSSTNLWNCSLCPSCHWLAGYHRKSLYRRKCLWTYDFCSNVPVNTVNMRWSVNNEIRIDILCRYRFTAAYDCKWSVIAFG